MTCPPSTRRRCRCSTSLDGPLPEDGEGAAAAIDRLVRVGAAAATHSSGPHFYHFVIGGSTPAAMAADWLVALLDQNVAVRASSAFATRVEDIAIRWLVELFGLPAAWGGALVASATFANFTGLGCATHWWAERHGVDSAADGLIGLPRMPVLSGGYVHASARKALQMLGPRQGHRRGVRARTRPAGSTSRAWPPGWPPWATRP